MRLDASTAECIKFLHRAGYSLHFPIIAENTEEQARIALKGENTAIVYRDESGRLRVTVEAGLTPPAPERLTYHDLLLVAAELDHRIADYRRLYAETPESPAFADKRSEYTAAENNLNTLRAKVGRILQAERQAAYTAEALELARIKEGETAAKSAEAT